MEICEDTYILKKLIAGCIATGLVLLSASPEKVLKKAVGVSNLHFWRIIMSGCFCMGCPNKGICECGANCRCACKIKPQLEQYDTDGHCVICGLPFEDPKELTHECPPGFIKNKL